mgnify:CR=1 FL=1
MTYREMLEEMKEFTEEQLDQDIMIFDSADKMFYRVFNKNSQPVVDADIHITDNIDPNHPYLVI